MARDATTAALLDRVLTIQHYLTDLSACATLLRNYGDADDLRVALDQRFAKWRGEMQAAIREMEKRFSAPEADHG